MTKKRREIECITRLNELTGGVEDILAFLLDEKVIEDSNIKTIKTASNPCLETYLMLKMVSDVGKIQLLEYEWTLLPVERIKIFIVTDRSSKEFTWNL